MIITVKEKVYAVTVRETPTKLTVKENITRVSVRPGVVISQAGPKGDDGQDAVLKDTLIGNEDDAAPTVAVVNYALDLRVPKSRTINGKTLANDIVLSKADFGLNFVDNTPDIDKPISNAVALALAGKVTPADVDSRIQLLIGGAPAAFDTLTEIAAQLGDDQDAIGALTSQISQKISNINGLILVDNQTLSLTGSGTAQHPYVLSANYLATPPGGANGSIQYNVGGNFAGADLYQINDKIYAGTPYNSPSFAKMLVSGAGTQTFALRGMDSNSRRTAFTLENNFQGTVRSQYEIGTDYNQNGTKDFYLYDYESGAPRLYIGPTGIVSIPNLNLRRGVFSDNGGGLYNGNIYADTNGTVRISSNNGPQILGYPSDFLVVSDGSIANGATRGTFATTANYCDFAFFKTNSGPNQMNNWSFGMRFDNYFGQSAGSFQIVGGTTEGGAPYRVPLIAEYNGNVTLAGNGQNNLQGRVKIGSGQFDAKLSVIEDSLNQGPITTQLMPNASGDMYQIIGQSLSVPNAAVFGFRASGTKGAFITTYGRQVSDFILTTQGFIGMGTDNPLYKVNIVGDDNTYRNLMQVRNSNTGSNSYAGIQVESAVGGSGAMQFIPSNFAVPGLRNTMLFVSETKSKLGFVSNSASLDNEPQDMYFRTYGGKSNSAIYIAGGSPDRVGINTGNDPSAISSPLTVNGGIESIGISNGFIFRSPNGSRWRYSVDNNGDLQKNLA